MVGDIVGAGVGAGVGLTVGRGLGFGVGMGCSRTVRETYETKQCELKGNISREDVA